MVAKGEQQPGVSTALELLVKRCLLIRKQQKEGKEGEKKKKWGRKKKRKPNQNWANQAGVNAGAKRELQRDGGLQMWNDCVSCAARTRLQSGTSCRLWLPLPPSRSPGTRQRKVPQCCKQLPRCCCFFFYLFHFIEALRLEEREEKRNLKGNRNKIFKGFNWVEFGLDWVKCKKMSPYLTPVSLCWGNLSPSSICGST